VGGLGSGAPSRPSPLNPALQFELSESLHKFEADAGPAQSAVMIRLRSPVIGRVARDVIVALVTPAAVPR